LSLLINGVNQSLIIDSKHALDPTAFGADNRCMHHDPNSQFLRRIDSSRNMARFYILLLQPTLFGETSLVRNWGRIGTRGREKVELFESTDVAAAALSALAARKLKRGYLTNGR
jgi:predicted DNA-binding WGR domain protein